MIRNSLRSVKYPIDPKDMKGVYSIPCSCGAPYIGVGLPMLARPAALLNKESLGRLVSLLSKESLARPTALLSKES